MADESKSVNQKNKDYNFLTTSNKTLRKNRNCILKKRNPLISSRKKNDIYISNKTNLKAELKKCKKFFNSGESEIFIHGLGAAINKACTLALKLQSNYNKTVDLDITTSTVKLTDDIIPLINDDDDDFFVNKRQNSAIHIRMFKIVNFGMLKYAKETKK